MLLRLLTFSTALFLFALRSRAQAYEPGVLVRANGDTLRGEIENGFWEEPPEYIRYRQSPNSPSLLFKPQQLRTVTAGGRHFRYEGLPIDHAADTRLDRLPQGYHAHVVIDSVLAEVLVEGEVGLMRVARIGSTHYLVRRAGAPVLDLSDRKYLHTGPYGQLEVVDGNNYRGQLGLYFGDCPAATGTIGSAEFSAEGLASVVQAFNETCGRAGRPGHSWLAQAAPHRRLAAGFGVMAGGRLFYQAENGGHLLKPTGGIYGELLLPNRTVSLYGDLNLSRVSGPGGSVQTGSVASSTVINGVVYNYTTPVFSDFTYRAWLVAARVGVRRYVALPHEQQLFIGAGFALDAIAGRTFALPAGAMTTPNNSDFDNVSIPRPYVGVGWRRRRLAVSADAMYFQGVYDFRLGLACRLTRHPDTAKATP